MIANIALNTRLQWDFVLVSVFRILYSLYCANFISLRLNISLAGNFPSLVSMAGFNIQIIDFYRNCCPILCFICTEATHCHHKFVIVSLLFTDFASASPTSNLSILNDVVPTAKTSAAGEAGRMSVLSLVF